MGGSPDGRGGIAIETVVLVDDTAVGGAVGATVLTIGSDSAVVVDVMTVVVGGNVAAVGSSTGPLHAPASNAAAAAPTISAEFRDAG